MAPAEEKEAGVEVSASGADVESPLPTSSGGSGGDGGNGSGGDDEETAPTAPPADASGDEGMKPMPVKTSSELASPAEGASAASIGDTTTKHMSDLWSDLQQSWRERPRLLPAKYRLVTEDEPLKYSMLSLQFAVLCSAINTKMLNPNYPLMVSGQHPESFPDTEPFDFNSATYFIPMMSLLGVAIASLFVGRLSDRVGRKKPLIIMGFVSGCGSIVKYFARHTFWGFCIVNLIFGFFLGNLPIAMAYVGDVYTSKVEKEKKLGQLVGNFVMGNSGGGMIAILMNGSGLFAPLWVGAGLMFVATVVMVYLLIEPGDERLTPIGKDALIVDDEEEEHRPETINQKVMWNVIGGAVADNFGSTALFPLCLSPLALEQYTLNFINAGEEPIMSIVGYQWLSVCVALMVVPSTMITPHIFARIGAAGTCVFGNVSTAIITMALLFIGTGPATTAAFAGFVTVLYLGFPFTVFSQLTTGPMLDVIAPEDKIGYVQGLNNSAMNFGMAIAPWLFGVLADATTTSIAIWTGIGISFGAALVNTPLMFLPEMGPPPKKVPPEQRLLNWEDEELQGKALRGSYVPDPVLFAMNRKRAKQNKPFIVAPITPYSEDRDNLDVLEQRAHETFLFRRELQDQVLAQIADPDREGDVEELCRLLNVATRCDEDVVQETTDDLGKWIGQYLLYNGYHPHINSVLTKQMVMTAFPPIMTDKEFTPENIEGALVRKRTIMNEYLEIREKKKYSYSSIFGKGQRPQFYS